jgi:hypothetical protein
MDIEKLSTRRRDMNVLPFAKSNSREWDPSHDVGPLRRKAFTTEAPRTREKEPPCPRCLCGETLFDRETSNSATLTGQAIASANPGRALDSTLPRIMQEITRRRRGSSDWEDVAQIIVRTHRNGSFDDKA